MKNKAAAERKRKRKALRKRLEAHGVPCDWKNGVLWRRDRYRIASGVPLPKEGA